MGKKQVMQVFSFDKRAIRTIAKNGEPWFVGKDVAAVLGYVKPENAIKAHCKRQDTRPFESGGQVRHMTVIHEKRGGAVRPKISKELVALLVKSSEHLALQEECETMRGQVDELIEAEQHADALGVMIQIDTRMLEVVEYYSRLVMAFMDCFPGFRELNKSRTSFNA